MPKGKAGTGAKEGIVPRERYPSGKPKPEERGKAPALVKRIMDYAVKLGADARCATVLGRMHLEGVITETEFAAGLLYAEDVGAWERLKGHPRRHARSPSFDAGYGRADLDLAALERMDPEAADKLKRKIERHNKRITKRYRKAQDCIPDRPIILLTLIQEVCCGDNPVHSVHYASVKAMLGNLAKRCYRLNDPDDQAPQRQLKPVSNADVKALAEGAVAALENWFDKRRGIITSFRLKHRAPWQGAAIGAFGHLRETGEVMAHAIKLPKRPGLTGEDMDKALLSAAEAKGWARAIEPRPSPDVSPDELKAAIDKLRPNKEVA